MYIILKDRRFVHGWEIPIAFISCNSTNRYAVRYPLVKTFSKLVFPQAPSPLFNCVSNAILHPAQTLC
jgi:hypothetical protein